MRRDVYIENDSGGLSVLAAAAADAIAEDARENDLRFVEAHQAMLLELYGDDSLPVRFVVDEPLTAAEEAEWIGRATWRIDAPDGRVIVMGGFDPDVLSWWLEAGDPDADGRGIGVVAAPPGSWRVDVYAHAGSMNGRAMLDEAGEPLGAAFRRSHPGRPFPVWLAAWLDFSGEEDPGHEELWKDVAASVAAGSLAIDAEHPSAIGFVIHLTPFAGALPEPPPDGWFPYDAGRRVPDVFPLGLPTEVADPNADWFLDRALQRERPSAPVPAATELVQILDAWEGEPPAALGGSGGPAELAPEHAWQLYWIAGMASDSPPPFELRVSGAPGWEPPEARPEFAVAALGDGAWAIAAPPHSGGWAHWWGARAAAEALAGVPDGATIELATQRAAGEDDDEGADPAVGRMRWRGPVANGRWLLSEASPAVEGAALGEALGFMREVDRLRIEVRDAEREAFEEAAGIFAPEGVEWDGQFAQPVDRDERTALIVAEPVFRTRFGGVWPCDEID